MELVKNGYLRQFGHGDNWRIEIDPPTRKVKTYFEETCEVAEYMYANKTGKIHVYLSGGLDSLYVAQVLLRLKMDFDPVLILVKSKDGEVYNRNELRHAYAFCAYKDLKPIEYDFNYDAFVESGKLLEVSEETRCSSLAMNTMMHVMKQLDGFVVLGSADPSLHLTKEGWMVGDPEYLYSLLRYFERYNLAGCPFFLQYSSEMLLAWLLEPSIAALAAGKFPGKTSSNSTKAQVYNNGSRFHLPSYDYAFMGNDPYDPEQHRVKLTGYELVYKSPIMHHPVIKTWLSEYRQRWNGNIYTPYAEIVNRLSVHQ